MIEFNTPRFSDDVAAFLYKNDAEKISESTGLSVSSLYRLINSRKASGIFPNMRTFTTLVNAMGKSPQRYFTKG